MEGIRRVAVIGSGLMGHGIAQVFAAAGLDVVMQDIERSRLDEALRRIRLNLEALSAHGIVEKGEIDSILSRIRPTLNLEEAVEGADFVTESVSENLELKQDLFRAMARKAGPDAILASNTSMLTISDIGKEVEGKERLVITHWFNPPYLIPVVEVVKGEHTSEETVEKCAALLKKAGKIPIRIDKEVPGHLLNRIQFAMFREILSLLQKGVATAEEIDKAVMGSLGLRFAAIGPLRSIDLAGLDLFWYGMSDMYRLLDASDHPPDIIRDKVAAGHAGKRSGQGFYEYPPTDPVYGVEQERDEKIMALLSLLYPKKGN